MTAVCVGKLYPSYDKRDRQIRWSKATSKYRTLGWQQSNIVSRNPSISMSSLWAQWSEKALGLPELCCKTPLTPSNVLLFLTLLFLSRRAYFNPGRDSSSSLPLYLRYDQWSYIAQGPEAAERAAGSVKSVQRIPPGEVRFSSSLADGEVIGRAHSETCHTVPFAEPHLSV